MSSLSSIEKIHHPWNASISLLLYSDVFANDLGQSWLQLLRSIRQPNPNPTDCLQAYSRWFQQLVHKETSWQDFLITAILEADNSFTRQTQQRSLQDLPPVLLQAAQQDLRSLQTLYNFPIAQIAEAVQTIAHLPTPPLVWQLAPGSLPEAGEGLRCLEDWGEGLATIVEHYRTWGTGLFGRYGAFRWQGDRLKGISHPDSIRLKDLMAYETPKAQLVQNTEFLLAGYAALNVLLYGSRGAGKSSLIKALLNEYCQEGLRLIEVAKADLHHLPVIVEQLRSVPQKFILFVDDLSFEEDDDAFKALKVVLEGGVVARPQNVVVYATSNRRHLVREFFEERPRPKDADEIHHWDTLQEKLSFSDRFGLTLTFEPADQETYLEIVRHLVQQAKLDLDLETVDFRARQWATRHNGRSGRTARQFVDWLIAEYHLSSKIE
jgi:predicted AAA+ superfamily ATPase